MMLSLTATEKPRKRWEYCVAEHGLGTFWDEECSSIGELITEGRLRSIGILGMRDDPDGSHKTVEGVLLGNILWNIPSK